MGTNDLEGITFDQERSTGAVDNSDAPAFLASPLSRNAQHCAHRRRSAGHFQYDVSPGVAAAVAALAAASYPLADPVLYDAWRSVEQVPHAFGGSAAMMWGMRLVVAG